MKLFTSTNECEKQPPNVKLCMYIISHREAQTFNCSFFLEKLEEDTELKYRWKTLK